MPMTKRGDRIVVEAGKVGKSARAGVIEDVLQGDPPRFLVRWEDGRLSTFTPSSGSARIVAGNGASAKTAPAKPAAKAAPKSRTKKST
jgi:hypothetical protein